MLFNVSGLLKEGIGATRQHPVEGTIMTEGRPPEPIVGQAEFLRTRSGVLVRAHLHLVEPGVCSRCLRPLGGTVQISFEEEFQPTSDFHGGEPIADRDPDAFLIDEQHTLDLTEAVRQYREVSAEMQPLCRPDCRGLCPVCGRDLNQGECDCDRSAYDDRWAALAELCGSTANGKD